MQPPLTLTGILVGGRGTRMGGVAKGMLPSGAGPSIVERLVAEAARALPGGEVVLVGGRPEYAGLKLTMLKDASVDGGPLAGLLSLVRYAAERDVPTVLTLACDLPYLTAPLIERLHAFSPSAQAAAPRVEGIWQPMFARYSVARTEPIACGLLAANKRAVFRVLDALRAAELPLSQAELAQLRDWDTPKEVAESEPR